MVLTNERLFLGGRYPDYNSYNDFRSGDCDAVFDDIGCCTVGYTCVPREPLTLAPLILPELVVPEIYPVPPIGVLPPGFAGTSHLM